jgi:RNA polymerase sigma factor (sigma-70 family)
VITNDWVNERLTRWQQQRDISALGDLIKWQRNRAYAIAVNILGYGREADAEDAVQQAAIKLLTRNTGFENEEQFKITVYRAVVQCALDIARANRSRKKVEGAIMTQAEAADPQSRAETQEMVSILRQEMNELPADDRALLVLCCQDGLSLSAAAQVLEQPRETLRDRLTASLTRLRKRFSSRDMSMSLVLLVSLVQQNNVSAAPASLCGALNTALAGTPCSEIAAAGINPAAPASILSASGMSAPSFPQSAILAGLCAVGVAITGVLIAFPNVLLPKSPASHAGIETRTAPPSEVQKTELPPADSRGAVAAAGKQRPAPQDLKAAARRRSVAETPDIILNAAARAVPGMVVEEVEKEFMNNLTFFEVKGAFDGKKFEITVNEAGKVVKIEAEDDEEEDDVPQKQPVQDAAPGQGEF